MKYKVGDKVRIRKDIKLGEDYGGVIVTMSMLRYRGEVSTIQDTDCDGCYYFEENIYGWAEDMIEGLAEEAQPKESEKAINLLREMKHNCEHANKYDDPKRHDKAKALGFAIELIEHDCSAVENYKPEKLKSNSKECFGTPGGEANEITNNGNTIRPGYYKSSMGDVFDIANAYGLDMPLGTAVKYILRAGKKDKAKEIEDLQKAVRCIERAIDLRRDQH